MTMIDHQDRRHDQERHRNKRSLERLRRALELPDQGRRRAEACLAAVMASTAWLSAAPLATLNVSVTAGKTP